VTEADRKRRRRIAHLGQAAVFVALVVLAVAFYDSARWLVTAAATYAGVSVGSVLFERRKHRD
jgi:hypothetical protein